MDLSTNLFSFLVVKDLCSLAKPTEAQPNGSEQILNLAFDFACRLTISEIADKAFAMIGRIFMVLGTIYRHGPSLDNQRATLLAGRARNECLPKIVDSGLYEDVRLALDIFDGVDLSDLAAELDSEDIGVA